MFRIRATFFLTIAAFLVLLPAAWTQSTSAIQGTVLDSSGAVVPNAKVTIRNQATSAERTTETNSSGTYEVPSLPPGTYDVGVEVKGFQHVVAKSLVLLVDRNSVQNFTLKVADTSQVLTVESTAPVIEVTTSTVGQAIDQHTVQEVPLNGRHFVDLGLLIPGSVTPPQNGFLTAPLRGQGSFAFNTAGNREDTVNFMVNGINLNDMVQNQITFQPSINTVSEFKVDNSTYSAEYGRNSGAIVNIATRSGSNNYHGEVFDFLRNEMFDARNFFNIPPARQSTFKRNNFGANFGGPIVRDKTFFFLSYEGLRQRQGITLNPIVLTTTQRASVTNPISQQLLNFIPAANDPTGTLFLGSATAPVDIDQGTGDVSHEFSSSLRLHGYYAIQHDLRQEPTLQGNRVPGFGDTRQSQRQIGTLSLDQTFTPNLVNEARIGFNRIHITFNPNSHLNPVSLGILDGNNFNSGLPQISIQGTQVNFGGPAGFPQGRGDTTAVVSDTLNYLYGKHSFKFGGEFRRFYNDNFNSDTGTLTFADVNGFAKGTPSNFTLTPGTIASRIATGEMGFFVQDNWKILSRLTLELGFRYDWNQTPTEARNRFSNFIPSQDALVQVASPYKQNNKNFQPRVGFAWDIFGSGKTVVRSGYAVLTDQPITNLVTGLASNPPLASPQAFNGSKTVTTTYATLLPDAKASGIAPTVVDPNFKNSYIQSYNLNIQQQISGKWSMMLGYFGSQGRHLRTRVNLNQIIALPNVRPFQNPTCSGCPPPVVLGNISDNMSIGNSSYNALWLSSEMRPWHGLQFNASYTYSKSLDFTSQNGQGIVIQNSLNPAGDKGVSDYNARHRFVISSLYELPFKGNRFFEGWQVGGIVSDQSGNPVNLVVTGVTGLTGVASLRPDLIAPVQIVNQRLSSGNIQWFAPSLCDPTKLSATPNPSPTCAGATFSISTLSSLHFGSLPRNVITGPRFDNVDFSIRKRTRITERLSNELRLEAFDLFNHPNFGQPGGGAQLVQDPKNPSGPLIPSSTFGVISSTRFPIGDSGSARQLQFSVKFLF